jgi:hypothetical protein
MIFFVADSFAEHYEGGAELTTEAIIQGSFFPCNKILSSNPKLIKTMKEHPSSFWIFGNFSQIPEGTLLYAAKNINYSVLEYDYKYCKYRSSGKHIEAEGSCNCEETRNGKIVSIFLSNSKTTWWMSENQLKHYQNIFPFMRNNKNKVLSSVLSKEKLDYIASLDVKQKNDTYLILNSPSWIKGVEDAKKYAEENNLKYELVWGLQHKELLSKLAESKGIIFFPKAYDTCPRMTIEAKLLECELILNENVQHKDEDWFQTKESTLEYLNQRTSIFWNDVESVASECLGIPSHSQPSKKNNNFKFVIPLYNCEDWITKCIKSIKRQNYKNFKCILIDDLSTDNSVKSIQEEIDNCDRFELVINKEKKFALRNIVEAIDMFDCEEEDIIILLDGDDWLASKDTLNKLVEAYDDDTLMTYGSYVFNPFGIKGPEPSQYPLNVIENNLFREDNWRASHLRTFKYKLWKNIDLKDLKDKNGNYYEMAYDQAIMLPLLEMSAERSKYIPEILHVYNKQNPLNVDKIKTQQQVATAKEIREKKRYNKI